jgi:hypothetical protein
MPAASSFGRAIGSSRSRVRAAVPPSFAPISLFGARCLLFAHANPSSRTSLYISMPGICSIACKRNWVKSDSVSYRAFWCTRFLRLKAPYVYAGLHIVHGRLEALAECTPRVSHLPTSSGLILVTSRRSNLTRSFLRIILCCEIGIIVELL